MQTPAASTRRCSRRVLFFTSLLMAGSLSAAEEPATDEQKRVLYLGLDVSMSLEDTIGPVVDADNQAVQVLFNGQRRRIPLRLGGAFRNAVVPRVGKPSVEITDLREERTYSRGNDPHADALAQAMVLATAQSAAAEVAERRMIRANLDAEIAGKAVEWAREQVRKNPGWTVTHQGPSQAQLDIAASSAQTLADVSYTPVYSSGRTGSEGISANGAEQNHDALGIYFTVSAQETVGDSYGIIRLFYRTPEKPDDVVSSIRFFRLPDLGPKARKVFFLHEGLTPGYKLDNYDIHIYTDGREHATNLSKNRIELTLDEIHQFLMLKYGTENPGGIAPVGIATELLENDLRALVPPDQLNRAVDVVVDDKGRATKVTLENTGWSSADAYLTEVLMNTRFLPALRNHKPVTDTGRFVLSEFFP